MNKHDDFDPMQSSAIFADGPRLLADIGGTHARVALEIAPGMLRHALVLMCDDFAGFLPLLRFYLQKHPDLRPNHAAIAIANPVSGDQVQMTNRNWAFSTGLVRSELGLKTLLVVNDFTALAMSLPRLRGADLLQVGDGVPVEGAVMGLLGPGTGLGVSGIIPAGGGFVALNSEGGHSNFAPSDQRECAILEFAWRQWSHVSNERLMSGPGLELIYRALADRNRLDVIARSAPDIVSGALHAHDPLCLEVLECFCAMLGSASANLAVILGARGGIYIGGGIVPRLGEWFAQSSFRARFEAKGRFSGYVAKIPTYVIMAPNPAFTGVAAILADHLH